MTGFERECAIPSNVAILPLSGLVQDLFPYVFLCVIGYGLGTGQSFFGDNFKNIRVFRFIE